MATSALTALKEWRMQRTGRDQFVCNYDENAMHFADIPEGDFVMSLTLDGDGNDDPGETSAASVAETAASQLAIPGDCDGNQLDALGECGGPCEADADADGICDDVDPCVGELDACGVCNGPGAIYECGCADIPEGDCDCDGNVLDECGICGGTDPCQDC